MDRKKRPQPIEPIGKQGKLPPAGFFYFDRYNFMFDIASNHTNRQSHRHHRKQLFQASSNQIL